jgi:hypothetical protein
MTGKATNEFRVITKKLSSLVARDDSGTRFEQLEIKKGKNGQKKTSRQCPPQRYDSKTACRRIGPQLL